jgi:hypothetical protein
MIVTTDKVGDYVTCSKCNQQVEVTQSRAKPKKPKSAEPAKPSKKAQPKKKHPAANAATKTKSKSKSKPKAQSKKNSKTGYRLSKSETTSGAKGNTILVEAKPCDQCGSDTELGRCTACKFVFPKYEKLYSPLKAIPIRTTGFQRWFCQRISDSGSIGLLAYCSHALLTLLTILLIALGVACINGYLFNKQIGITIISIIGVVFLYYSLFAWKVYQFGRKPVTKLTWFQRPMWNFVLHYCRILRWQYYDRRLKGRSIIRVRDKAFHDGRLLALPGIQECNVLDLQKTQITNKGVAMLYELPKLQIVVLRKTKATPEAVYRLQQSFPHLWVWH